MIDFAKAASSFSADHAHANEFADLVRLAAHKKLQIQQFVTQYFSLMHRNCFAKLQRRMNELRLSLKTREKSLTDPNNKAIPQASPLDQIRALLKDAVDSNARRPRIRDTADVEALKVVGGTENIFNALLQIIESMTKLLSIEETAEVMQNLCVHCWIIGTSTTLQEMTKTNVCAQDILRAAANLGEYFRGTEHLFMLLSDERLRNSMNSFELLAVPSTSDRIINIERDWYRVIETIYPRVKGKPLPVLRHKLYPQMQAVVRAYERFDGRFIRHVELDLIEHLMDQNLRPTVIGISKLCCSLCNAWIEMVNSEKRLKWKVGGCHGRIYQWARDINAVLHPDR